MEGKLMDCCKPDKPATVCQKTPGVLDAQASYEKGEAWIKYDDQKVTVAKLREVINSTGFKAGEEKKGKSNNDRQNTL